MHAIAVYCYLRLWSKSGEAAPRPTERSRGFVGDSGGRPSYRWPQGAVRSGAHRAGGVEAPTEELPHGGDEALRRVNGRRRRVAEALAEGPVASQGFRCGGPAPRSVNLVHDGLAAKAAHPSAVEPLPDPSDVRRRALLRQAATGACGPHDLRLRVPCSYRRRLAALHFRRHRRKRNARSIPKRYICSQPSCSSGDDPKQTGRRKQKIQLCAILETRSIPAMNLSLLLPSDRGVLHCLLLHDDDDDKLECHRLLRVAVQRHLTAGAVLSYQTPAMAEPSVVVSIAVFLQTWRRRERERVRKSYHWRMYVGPTSIGRCVDHVIQLNWTLFVATKCNVEPAVFISHVARI